MLAWLTLTLLLHMIPSMRIKSVASEVSYRSVCRTSAGGVAAASIGDLTMEPWYRVATPRKEVREGPWFKAHEFSIHLEQVIAQTARENHRTRKSYFARTWFTGLLN